MGLLLPIVSFVVDYEAVTVKLRLKYAKREGFALSLSVRFCLI